MSRILAAAVVALIALAGCSDIEPGTGTKIVFAIDDSDPSRELIAETCRYLVRRSVDVLDADRARVASIKDGKITLLLPGRQIDPRATERILDAASVEFYHLRHVATQKSPDREWRIKTPEPGRASYLFMGPKAQVIDSLKEPDEVLKRVVGSPAEKPVLTGAHVLPTANSVSLPDGIVVNMDFDEEGARIFHEFAATHRGEYLAVFYNGLLISAPVITKPTPGGRAAISGFRTLAQAHSAVSRLNAGRLPLKIRIESVETY